MDSKINIYPSASISRSYSRKIQLKQFEPTDVFCSLNFSWFGKHPNEEEYKEKSTELYNLCKKIVEKEISELIAVKNDKPPF